MHLPFSLSCHSPTTLHPHCCLHPALCVVRRNCFLSYTETDGQDVSLLLDATLLSHFRQSIQHLPGMTITAQQQLTPSGSALKASSLSPPPAASSPIQLIGFPLRAIQVLEGYGGHQGPYIISSVSGTLAAAHFSIFYVSTNHADYVLVQEQQLEAVMGCLADRFLLIREEMECEDAGDAEALDDLPPHPPSKPDDEERKDVPAHSSEDEERMIREALLRSNRRHRRRERRANGEGGGGEGADVMSPLAEEGATEEESEGDEFSSTRESQSQASMTPPTSSLLSSTPLSPSPALSALSLTSSPSFSARPLQLQAMPYSLILHSLAHSDLPAFFSSLLQLIFFPSTPLTSPRFFSYTSIDSDYSLITQPPVGMWSLPPALSQAFQQSARWSVIEALGVFRYDEAGLVSRISRPLSDAGLRFFFFSSWRTGYVIVHQEDEERAKEALRLQYEVI